MRRREEDARAAALAKAVGAIHNAETHRHLLVERHEDTLRRAAEAAKGSDATLMERFSLYERHIIQLIGHADRDIQDLHAERSQRQEEFEASHRRRKMIDRLIERVKTRWNDHVFREERKTMEDSVAMRYALRADERRNG